MFWELMLAMKELYQLKLAWSIGYGVYLGAIACRKENNFTHTRN
jgi:hypothetical protein